MVRGTKGRIASIAATAVLIGVPACSAPGDGGSDSDAGASLAVGIAYEPETLSPLLGYGKDGSSKIFDGLLTQNADLELKPALAATLPGVSDDGLTYTYTLRDGVTFSDGEPLTADDVVFTYDTILDAKTNNPSRAELDAIKSVRAKDDRTVVFRLKYRYAPFAGRTVLPIVPKHAVDGQNVNTGSFNTKPIGTGPYVLTGWTKGEKLTFKANPDYWGGAPKVKKLTLAIVADDDVRATRLRSGDLDAAILPPHLAGTFEKDTSRKVFTAESADYRAVTLPQGGKVTGDRAVRRALDIAVDRQAIVDSVLDGAGHPAAGPLSATSPYHADGTKRDHDPRRAREILDRAGWKRGSDGIRAKGGTRASFTLWYFSGDKLRQDHALAYASDAKKVGVEVKVQAGTREVVRPRLDRDAMLMGNGNPVDPDYDLYGLLHSSLAGNGWNNMARYDNASVDKALDTARRTADDTERRAAYTQVQRALVEDPGYTFLTLIDHMYVVNDDWSGVTTRVEPHDHGLAGPWWNVEDWKPRS